MNNLHRGLLAGTILGIAIWAVCSLVLISACQTMLRQATEINELQIEQQRDLSEQIKELRGN